MIAPSMVYNGYEYKVNTEVVGMTSLVFAPAVLIGIILMAFILKILLKKKNPADIILFGIEVTIIGGILLLSEGISFTGSNIVGIFIVSVGLSISLAGIMK